MSRPGVSLLLVVALAQPLAAQKKADPVATELAVQAALQQSRQFLTRGQPARAVEVLEARLPLINGNADYLAALRDAYAALIRELEFARQDEQAAKVREKLQVLEGAVKPAVAPEPDPPPSKARGKIDPFQQTPLLDGGPDARELLRRAEAAFARKGYAEAGQLFAQAHAKDSAALGPRAADWAYCRLHGVVERVNAGKVDDPAALNREVTESLALAAGKPDLVKFGRAVQARLRALMPAEAAMPDGWAAAASANFRLLHHLAPAQAEKLLVILEKARAAAFEKWFGGPANPWPVRCDVYLYDDARDYAKATGKDARGGGHATLEVVERKVTRRRIDLAGDDPDYAVAALPREVTHVVLTDLFPDPMLPRWADEAMAIAAMPRAHVERYLRALPRVAREQQLLPLAKLIALKEFPEPAAITAFYVQSVSLVDVLVAEKGPQQFTMFLERAQRYGYEKALKEVYGLKSFAALQEKWQKKAFE